MKIETLIAMPAAGKTDAILSHVLETKEKAVIASPTRVLSEQSYNKFMKMGGRKAELDLALVLGKRIQLLGSTLRSRSDQFKADLLSDLGQQVWPLYFCLITARGWIS